MTGVRADIFDIKRYAINDGPGIRTTFFFPGCPLDCAWCQNPEALRPGTGIRYEPVRCIGCGRCGACPATDGEGKRYISRCIRCYKCADNCPTGAIKRLFAGYTAAELAAMALRDKPFFDQSGGGVTVSGGECLLHADFLLELFTLLAQAGISRVVDTCGDVPFSEVEKIAGLTDLFLYDLKLIDSEAHRRYTGRGNERILENLARLYGRGAKVRVRMPMIPGVTDGEANLRGAAEYLSRFGRCDVELLQFNALAAVKYDKPKFYADEETRAYPFAGIQPQEGEEMERFADTVREYGHDVTTLYNKNRRMKQ